MVVKGFQYSQKRYPVPEQTSQWNKNLLHRTAGISRDDMSGMIEKVSISSFRPAFIEMNDFDKLMEKSKNEQRETQLELLNNKNQRVRSMIGQQALEAQLNQSLDQEQERRLNYQNWGLNEEEADQLREKERQQFLDDIAKPIDPKSRIHLKRQGQMAGLLSNEGKLNKKLEAFKKAIGIGPLTPAAVASAVTSTVAAPPTPPPATSAGVPVASAGVPVASPPTTLPPTLPSPMIRPPPTGAPSGRSSGVSSSRPRVTLEDLNRQIREAERARRVKGLAEQTEQALRMVTGGQSRTPAASTFRPDTVESAVETDGAFEGSSGVTTPVRAPLPGEGETRTTSTRTPSTPATQIANLQDSIQKKRNRADNEPMDKRTRDNLKRDIRRQTRRLNSLIEAAAPAPAPVSAPAPARATFTNLLNTAFGF